MLLSAMSPVDVSSSSPSLPMESALVASFRRVCSSLDLSLVNFAVSLGKSNMLPISKVSVVLDLILSDAAATMVLSMTLAEEEEEEDAKSLSGSSAYSSCERDSNWLELSFFCGDSLLSVFLSRCEVADGGLSIIPRLVLR